MEGTQRGWRRARTGSMGGSCGQGKVGGVFPSGCHGPGVEQAIGEIKDAKVVVETEA